MPPDGECHGQSGLGDAEGGAAADDADGEAGHDLRGQDAAAAGFQGEGRQRGPLAPFGGHREHERDRQQAGQAERGHWT